MEKRMTWLLAGCVLALILLMMVFLLETILWAIGRGR